MKRVICISFIVLIFASLIFSLPNDDNYIIDAFGSSILKTISPSNRIEMINEIDEFLQKYIDERAVGELKLQIEGSYIHTYSVDNFSDEPYFSLSEPFYNYRYKAGNDYNAVCFDTEVGSNLSKSIQYDQNTRKLNDISLTYTFQYGESYSQKSEVETFAENTVKNEINSSMSNYIKIKALHDFLVNYSSYDTTYAYPYQLVSTKKGICQSYSGLFWMLLKKAGFESRIIFKGYGEDNTATANNGNNTEAHAWNLVLLDGYWYHIDATWDDPLGEQPILVYNYFLKSDATMSKDHSWDTNAYSKSIYDYRTGLVNNSSGIKPLPNTTSSSSKTASSKKPIITIIKSSTAVLASSSIIVSTDISSTVSSQDIFSITNNSLSISSKTGINKFFSSLFNFKNPLTIILFVFAVGILGFLIILVVIKIRKNKYY